MKAKAIEFRKVGGQLPAASAASGSAGAAAGTAWVPIIGPAIAGVSLALSLWLNRKGPQQKIASTSIVNELEPILAENRAAYLEGPRTKASQAAALKNFDDAWAWLIGGNACGNADLGKPGRACIADRQRGGQWDWFALYRDPIAADQAREDSFLEAAGLPAELTTEGSGLILAAALLLAGVLL